MLETNLVYLLRNPSEVLLIFKKRDFGKGKWNGPGGKLNPGEMIEGAAKREVAEETGYIVNELQKVGYIDFIWPEELKHQNQRTFIYLCLDFSGQLTETEECLPQWFKIKDLPFDKMWPDDKYWLLDALSGKEIKMRFYFDENNNLENFEKIS